MNLRPPPDAISQYVADDGRPTRDFYNWIKSLYDFTRGLTTAPLVTVASLGPPADNFGVRKIAGDATATTFWSVVVGGGTNIVPVISDGTDWRIG